MSYNQALLKWQEIKKTQYPNEEIKRQIDFAINCPSQEHALVCAEVARAMIQYNRMIDERIERAQKSWKE